MMQFNGPLAYFSEHNFGHNLLDRCCNSYRVVIRVLATARHAPNHDGMLHLANKQMIRRAKL